MTNNNAEKDEKSLGVIESIAEDLTSAKIKQAIIFSEIVGKPVSKRRNRRGR